MIHRCPFAEREPPPSGALGRGPRALPGPRPARPGPTLRAVPAVQRRRRADRDGLPLGGGPGVVRGPRLPALQRHPLEPRPPLGRPDGCRLGVPRAVGQRQRQHARPAGPARDVRAPDPAGDAHRVRRVGHRAGRRATTGQAAQRSQRRRRRPRTTRSGSPTPATGSSPTTRAAAPTPNCRPRSTGSIPSGAPRAGARRPRPPQRTVLLPGRQPASTSSTPARPGPSTSTTSSTAVLGTGASSPT